MLTHLHLNNNFTISYLNFEIINKYYNIDLYQIIRIQNIKMKFCKDTIQKKFLEPKKMTYEKSILANLMNTDSIFIKKIRQNQILEIFSQTV